MRQYLSLLLLLAAVAACAPKAPPLTGLPAPAVLPRVELAPGHRRMVFRWKLTDPDIRLNGDGVARIAAPDSVRLDFFVDGGMGGGRAIMIGDELRAPGMNFIGRYLPDPPVLWATLGRVHVPAASDTVVRVDGDTLRADIGRDTRWRMAFVDRELRRLERIEGGRLREWVVRDSSGRSVRYEQPMARRVLEITVVGTEAVSDFDESIWK